MLWNSMSAMWEHLNATLDWSDAIAQTDLLTMYDKRDTMSSSLRLPDKRDPLYRHTIPSAVGQNLPACCQHEGSHDRRTSAQHHRPRLSLNQQEHRQR